MIQIYKSKPINIPQASIITKVYHQIIGYCIDFIPALLPIIPVILNIYLTLTIELFAILYSIALFFSLLWIIYITINFYNIKVKRYTFVSNKITQPVKIAFVSDLHIGYFWTETNKYKLNKIINIINGLNPNVTIIGGDILNHNFTPKLVSVLKNINGSKLAVLGNHDHLYISKEYTKETEVALIKKLEECNIQVLQNEGYQLTNEIFIGGIKDLYTLDFDINRALKGSKNNQYKILISHNPDIISYTEDLNDIDLILSGHNHSGQINFLGFRLPMPTMRKWLTQGIYEISKTTKLLLSSGVGASETRLRIGTNFEILEIEIEPENATL